MPFLGFCTNAYPAEDFDLLLQKQIPLFKNLFHHAGSLKNTANFLWALDLQLGPGILNELANPSQATKLAQCFQEHQLTVGSLNLFPLCPFQEGPVKKRVYSPDWHDPKRAEFTLLGARWVAQHLQPSEKFVISTLAGQFHPSGPASSDDFKKLAASLSSFACDLSRLKEETGCHIQLALEPEPMTTIQKNNDVIHLWEHFQETAARDHLAINLDCCHFSVMGEDPLKAFKTFLENGIPVPKIHASTALDISNPSQPHKKKILEEMIEEQFLHQTVFFYENQSSQIYDDLPQALQHLDNRVERATCHFHLPLFLIKDNQRLETTSKQTQSLLSYLNDQPLKPHIFAETYTWSVFKDRFAQNTFEGIASELDWLKESFKESSR